MRAMFKKFYAKFRIGLCYLLFALANIVFAAVIGICLILSLFGLRDYKKKINAALRIIVRLLSITIFPSVGGYKVKIDGLENIQKTPSIYTFNHISLLDPLFAISLIPNAAVVVKGKYDSILAIWLLTRFFDFISTGDGSRGDIERAMGKISDAVGRGCNLIVFPEGTRMNGERLGDFKSMAFRLSRRTGIDIVPAAIVSSEPVFTRGTPLLPEKTGFAFHIKILPPLSPSDFNSADSLAAKAFRVISAECKIMRVSKKS